MRYLLVIGLTAIVTAADGCAEAETEVPNWGCWGEPVSSAWATDTNWQYVTGEGDYGWRTERVRMRVGHPYSVDLDTSDYGGELRSTERRVHLECSDGNSYYDPASWDAGAGTLNPGCLQTVVRARAQVRGAFCD